MKRIAEELKLTDEQKPKFEAAMKEQTEKLRHSVKTPISAQEDRRETANIKNLTANMKKILTRTSSMGQDAAGRSPRARRTWQKPARREAGGRETTR
jgi:hypothetical protein